MEGAAVRLRRVAVTGVGLVTPLGAGAAASWAELLAPGLPPPSAVAPVDREALAGAGLGAAPWEPRVDSPAAERTGVAIGAGMSCTAEFAAAAAAVGAGRARRLSPFFVPKVLVNSPAGVVSIAHGL